MITTPILSPEEKRERNRIRRNIQALSFDELGALLVQLVKSNDEVADDKEQWRLKCVELTVSRAIEKMRRVELQHLEIRLMWLINAGFATTETRTQLANVRRQIVHKIAGAPKLRAVQGGSPGLTKRK